MRLVELKMDDARKLTRTTWDQKAAAEQWLKDHGFKKISNKEAKYGTVWTDHKKSVVKVFSHDPCFKKFIDFCRSNRGDPHLPRLTKLYPIGDNGGVIFIERLKPLSFGLQSLANDIRDYFVNQQRIAAGSKYFKPVDVFEDFIDFYPTLVNTLNKLAVAFPRDSGCQCDLHHRNMMMRGNTIVITDPMDGPSEIA